MPTKHCVSDTFEAPLMIIGVGGSLAVVGTVPVVITLSLGINTSATIIGVGFIGFGFLIIVPGMCWCLVSYIYQYRCPWRHRRGPSSKSIVEQEALVRSDIELPTINIYTGAQEDQHRSSIKKHSIENSCKQNPTKILPRNELKLAESNAESTVVGGFAALETDHLVQSPLSPPARINHVSPTTGIVRVTVT